MSVGASNCKPDGPYSSVCCPAITLLLLRWHGSRTLNELAETASGHGLKILHVRSFFSTSLHTKFLATTLLIMLFSTN